MNDLVLLECPCRYSPMLNNGLGYLSQALSISKYEHDVIDLNYFLYNISNRKELWGNPFLLSFWSNREAVEKEYGTFIDYFVAKHFNNYKYIGFSVHENNRVFCTLVKERLSKDKIVIGGGYDFTYDNGPLLFPCDKYIIGQGESSLIELLNSNKTFISNKELNDIDYYPEYRQWALYNYKKIPILGSRGCSWGNCTFCCEKFKFQTRSVDSLYDEINYFNSRHKFEFIFNDSNMGNKGLLVGLANKLKGNNKFSGQMRIRLDNDKEFFKILKKMGFSVIRFGVDAFNDHSLHLQNKGYSVKDIINTLTNCHDAGIYTTVNVVLNIPEETIEDINESITIINSLKSKIDMIENINTLLIKKGNSYFDNYKELGIDITKVSDSCIKEEDWRYKKVDYIERLKRLDYFYKHLEVPISKYAKSVIEEKVKCLSYST